MATSSKHALIVGASSGIGLAVAQQVAPFVTKLTLCSRSCPMDLVASIKAKNPDVEVVHERLDMSLLLEVRKFTLKHATTNFDWVVLAAGMMFFSERVVTAEGLDNKMSTMYYARLNRPGVRVLCVLAAGQANVAPVMDDLGVKRSYSTSRCAHATVLYLDLMAQSLSEHAPLASFMHIDPGFVRTAYFDNAAWYMRLPMKAIAAVLADSPEKVAQVILKTLTAEEYAVGWKLLDKRAEEVPKTKFHTEELKDAVWEHTLQTIDNVLKQ
ncbi:hypothetical protein BBJ28_00005191 [Nothophytophthora sp. Chile5]|nr:hypothetical protein BBJ28_00005191 [Nothophytophthora sp. Chile5]